MLLLGVGAPIDNGSPQICLSTVFTIVIWKYHIEKKTRIWTAKSLPQSDRKSYETMHIWTIYLRDFEGRLPRLWQWTWYLGNHRVHGDPIRKEWRWRHQHSSGRFSILWRFCLGGWVCNRWKSSLEFPLRGSVNYWVYSELHTHAAMSKAILSSWATFNPGIIPTFPGSRHTTEL